MDSMLDRRAFLGSAAVTALAARSARADSLSAPANPGWPPAVFQDDESYWRNLRREFLIPAEEAFFNTGTLGSPPRVVLQAVTDHLGQAAGTIAHWDYQPEHPDYFTGYRPELEIRRKLAAVVGADPDEIALSQNATLGANYVANGLDLRPGDEVIITNQEHIGCEGPWQLKAKRYGVYVKKVTVPVPPESPQQLVDLYVRATTPQTRVWAIPHLTSALAIRFPVEEMCRLARERGIISVIDGAQCCGHFTLDLHRMGCDAYFSSPHKWLLAPAGSGFLYVSRERLPALWATLASGNWDNYNDGAFRLMQIGTGSLSILKGYEAAIDFHQRMGSARVERRIIGLADRLRAGLRQIPQVRIWSPQHPELVSATTVWSLEGYPAVQLMDALWTRSRIRCRSMGDPWGVRQCCHIYNSPQEIDRTLETVRRMTRERRTG
jgi:selenocysteine lyase/cysteine desulfurase